ncbi:MAG: methylated-DNA--[protein]-cysteine S-methyltransferase, partial [Candidatus Thermoplasmatota archaeon]|nr:methylated-DNA--[protein]-cysteine S-methyltransferase [Candidatus Thermoplasmatota archaeon]
QGTDFQKRVWSALRTIPYGEVRTYQQVADMIDMPKAYRAVANACASNPVPLVVPCHRVVRKDDGLGGYALGIWRKEYLLKMEKKNSDK